MGKSLDILLSKYDKYTLMWHIGIPRLRTQVLDAGLWTLDAGL